MNMQRLGQTTRTLVTALWLPALFMAGVLSSYLLAFHHPAPHHISIAVAAAPTATVRAQDTQLDVAVPGGFTLRPVAGAAGARSAVLHLSAVAAYVPAGSHPLLYGAKADGLALETIVHQTFAAVAARTGGTLVFRELVPTVPGDALGTSPLYLILACVVPAYVMVVTMQRAVGFGLVVAGVVTFIAGGAVAAAASYLVAAYAVHAIPQHPLDLLYLFLLTQAVSLTSYGLVPFSAGSSLASRSRCSSCWACPAAAARSRSRSWCRAFSASCTRSCPWATASTPSAASATSATVGYCGLPRCSAPGSPSASRSS